MPWSIKQADAVYDNTHPWDSLFNGGPANGLTRPDPRQQKLMAQALSTGSLDCPAEVIRDTMTNPPQLDAGPSRPQPTIDSVLDGSALRPATLYEQDPNMAGGQATSRPSVQW